MKMVITGQTSVSMGTGMDCCGGAHCLGTPYQTPNVCLGGDLYLHIPEAAPPHPESLSSPVDNKAVSSQGQGRQWAWLGGEGIQKQRHLY